MSTNKIIGIILIVGSLYLGYAGINKISENDLSFEVLDVDIDVSNKSGKRQGYIYLGLAALVFIGGTKTLRSS